MNRDFKGIWIPREIWCHPHLSPQAKILWGEIDSKFDPLIGGYSTSKWKVCEFMGLKVRSIHSLVTQLRKNGCLERVCYDGRQTVWKAILPEDSMGDLGEEDTEEVDVSSDSSPYLEIEHSDKGEVEK